MWGRYLFSGVLGLIAGGAGAVGLVFGPIEMGGLSAGPWRTNTMIGNPDAGPVVRAAVARRGLLALNRSETVYFNAGVDSEGRPLSEDCAYRVTFHEEPAARWWSLTLYAEDDFLAVNGREAHSINAEHAAGAAEDPMSVIVSARSDWPSWWISAENAGAFDLTLRLYHPDPAIIEDPARAGLPEIERIGCGETM